MVALFLGEMGRKVVQLWSVQGAEERGGGGPGQVSEGPVTGSSLGEHRRPAGPQPADDREPGVAGHVPSAAFGSVRAKRRRGTAGLTQGWGFPSV